MARLLYQYDSYIREFKAIVVKVKDNKVFLDQTAFHPGPSGGLDTDKGFLTSLSGEKFDVLQVFEEEGDFAHVVSEGKLRIGEEVKGVIDWERRYRMMKLHTASHVLLAILYKKYNALVTGGHITPDEARDDFDISDVKDWKEAIITAVDEANNLLRKSLEVKIYWLPREEALRIPGIVKLAERLPPNTPEVRIVEIPGVDLQADGGPHVRNTGEVGQIIVRKMESKGARRKRVYYTVRP
ncbi:MAG: alanyl-tRNA editing protein AlaXM [Thermofilaceae archaeon]